MTDSEYNLRLDTSRSDDIEAFVPDNAEALWGNDDATNPVMLPIYITDEKAYHTGIHCARCYCDVVVHDRQTGVASCPNCGWSDADRDEQSWEERAEQLEERGGLPELLAEGVALLETGRSQSEVADELGLEHRSNVGTMVKRYREQHRCESEWLSAHGPDI